MNSLKFAYTSLYKSTEKLVRIYSPKINLNYLRIDDNTSFEEISKNIKMLNDFNKCPEFSHIIIKHHNSIKN